MAEVSHGGDGGGIWRSPGAKSWSLVTAGCGVLAAAACPQFAQNRAPCFISLPHWTQNRR
jgi:hypothetical protein